MNEVAALKQARKGVCLEKDRAGRDVARDPRKISREELAKAHEPMGPLKALRLRCLDCCGGGKEAPNEVRLCTAWECPSWPFRMRTNPWREKRQMAPEQLEKLRAGMAARQAEKAQSDEKPRDSGEVDPPK